MELAADTKLLANSEFDPSAACSPGRGNVIQFPNSRSSPFCATAVDYTERGLPAIPAMPGGKVPGIFDGARWHPMVGWQKYADAMPTDEEFAQWDTWPGANICMPLGGISGIMAVDIDMEGPILAAIERELSGLLFCRKRGAKGFTAFMQCAGTPWGSKNSLQSKWNITKRNPDGTVVLDPQGRPKLDRVVDIIAYGKQTVLPPSLHPDGMHYEWLPGVRLDQCTAAFDLPVVPVDLCERISRAIAPFRTEDDKWDDRDHGKLQGVTPAETWFRDLNNHALANLHVWIPALVPRDVPSNYLQPTGDGYRIKPYWRGVTDAHKVSVKPTGIRDFAEDRGYTPIDLVMAARALCTSEAINWLNGYVHLPDPLGGVEISFDTASVEAPPMLGEQSGPPAVLRTIAVRDLAHAVAEQVKHVVAPYVPEGEVTLLGGHGGVGKTMFAQVLAAHVACGRDWADCAVSGGRVVFVSLEDPAPRVVARLRGIAEAYGLDMALIEQRFVILDGTEGQACLAVEETARGRSVLAFARAMDEVEHAAPGARLIIIDNASDAFDANENERRMVRAFIRRLRAIAKANQAGLILLAHIDKQAARMGGAGNTYSGSTAWHNSVRSRLALVDVDGVVELRHEKNNLGKKAEPLPLRFTDGGVLVPSFTGEVFDGNDDVLLHCMAQAIQRGDIISTARAGPGNAHAHVRALPGFPPVLAPPRKFWAAVARLEQEGKLMRETYTNSARKSRQRWTIPVAPDASVIATSAYEE